MHRETRRAPGSEIRLDTGDDGTRYLTVRAITPGVVDDYGSLWNPHAFDASAARRMPTLTWGHDWAEPLGRAEHYEPSDDGPTLRFRVDDPDAVPTARRAIAQVESGTLDDVSVGFSGTERRAPTDEERRTYPGIREVIESANLDEVALVLRGAVPGAKVLSLRSADGAEATIALDTVLDLGRQVAAGTLTQDEAIAAAQLHAKLTDPTPPAAEGEPVVPDATAAQVEALLAEAADTLGAA